ncbi:putative glycoside hydrolase [Myxococcota bacterium]|nr:putative glycoside hydrolase [Myxococcota bacterium]
MKRHASALALPLALSFALSGLGPACSKDGAANAAAGRPNASPAASPGPPTPGPGKAFERPLPVSEGRVLVFSDQLSQTMSDAQVRFVGKHYVGSQKLIRSLAARIRSHNPGFINLQYRLATGLSTVPNLTGEDTWDVDTVEPTAPGFPGDPRRTVEAHYLHDPPGSTQRVSHVDAYFMADVRNPAWHEAHIDEILRRMPLNAFDGIFLDTAHLRIDGFTPADWHVRFCDPDVTKLPSCWTAPAKAYFTRLVERLHAATPPAYAIGNYGPLITGWDTNEELAPLDGGMVELFMWVGGTAIGERDWHLAVDRILRLIGNERVMIAQPVGYADTPVARRWIAANFLLLQGRRSYAAFYPAFVEPNAAPVWLPEYEVDVGPPAPPRAPVGASTRGPSPGGTSSSTPRTPRGPAGSPPRRWGSDGPRSTSSAAGSWAPTDRRRQAGSSRNRHWPASSCSAPATAPFSK